MLCHFYEPLDSEKLNLLIIDYLNKVKGFNIISILLLKRNIKDKYKIFIESIKNGEKWQYIYFNDIIVRNIFLEIPKVTFLKRI